MDKSTVSSYKLTVYYCVIPGKSPSSYIKTGFLFLQCMSKCYFNAYTVSSAHTSGTITSSNVMFTRNHVFRQQ